MNSIFYFITCIFSMTIISYSFCNDVHADDLDDLISKIQEKSKISEVNKMGDIYHLMMEFNNYIVPLEISEEKTSWKKNKNFSFVIKNVNEAKCMDFSYDREKNKGELNLVVTEYSQCPLPRQRKGTYILDLVDHLAANLEIKKIRLLDAASVICGQFPSVKANLTILKIFQTGRGWYESHGYFSRSASKIYRDWVQSITQMSLDEANKIIRNESGKNISPDLIKEFKEKFPQENSFAKFMAYFWEADCREYAKLYEIIHPLLYEKYYDGMNELEKKFKIHKANFHLNHGQKLVGEEIGLTCSSLSSSQNSLEDHQPLSTDQKKIFQLDL